MGLRFNSPVACFYLRSGTDKAEEPREEDHHLGAAGGPRDRGQRIPDRHEPVDADGNEDESWREIERKQPAFLRLVFVFTAALV